eukprot:TRINITY_DN32547_c0_g1_i1.p1 TRINITY_DN32547_c0_g1~~TRINITY_DN32547_c0_g1_i1.p1  ORF type:complete len:872 (+),score=328.72 TRINITY_DN32547_c0_g1_i1:55-2670(+)
MDTVTVAAAAASLAGGAGVTALGGSATSALRGFAAAVALQFNAAAARQKLLLSGAAALAEQDLDGDALLCRPVPTPVLPDRPWLREEDRAEESLDFRAAVNDAAVSGCMEGADAAAAAERAEQTTTCLPASLRRMSAAMRGAAAIANEAQRVRSSLESNECTRLRLRSVALEREAELHQQRGDIEIESVTVADRIETLRELSALLRAVVKDIADANVRWAQRREGCGREISTAAEQQLACSCVWRAKLRALRSSAAQHDDTLAAALREVREERRSEAEKMQKLLGMQRAAKRLLAELVERVAGVLRDSCSRDAMLDRCSHRSAQLLKREVEIKQQRQASATVFAAAAAVGEHAVTRARDGEECLDWLRAEFDRACLKAQSDVEWPALCERAREEYRQRLLELHNAACRLCARQQRQVEALEVRASRAEAGKELCVQTLNPLAKRHSLDLVAVEEELKTARASLADTEVLRRSVAEEMEAAGFADGVGSAELQEGARSTELAQYLRDRLVTVEERIAAERIAVARLRSAQRPGSTSGIAFVVTPPGSPLLEPRRHVGCTSTSGEELESAKEGPPSVSKRVVVTAKRVEMDRDTYHYFEQNELAFTTARSPVRLRDHTAGELEAYESLSPYPIDRERHMLRGEGSDGGPEGAQSYLTQPMPKCPMPEKSDADLIVGRIRRKASGQRATEARKQDESWIAAMLREGAFVGAIGRQAADAKAATERAIQEQQALLRKQKNVSGTAETAAAPRRPEHQMEGPPMLRNGEPLLPHSDTPPAVTVRGYRTLQRHDAVHLPAHRQGIAEVVKGINAAVRAGRCEVTLLQPLKFFWSGLPCVLGDTYFVQATPRQWTGQCVLLHIRWDPPDSAPGVDDDD